MYRQDKVWGAEGVKRVQNVWGGVQNMKSNVGNAKCSVQNVKSSVQMHEVVYKIWNVV